MSLTDDEPTDEIFFEFTTGPCDVCTFATLVFSQRWTEQFLANELLDIDISVGHWEVDTIAHLPSSQQGISSQPVHPEKPTSLRRVARSFHPSAVSFPGLATHAENIKEQHLRLHKNRQKLTMRECTTLNGIPMSDYFVINMVWIIENVPSPYSRENLNSMKGSACNTVCRVRIYIEIDFKKSTWFQGTIISNTKAELLSVCEKWRDSVIRDVLDRPFVNDELSAVFKDRKLDSGNTAASGVPAVGGNSVQYSDPVCMLWGEDGIKSEPGAVLPAAPAHPRSRTSSEANMTYSMSSDGSVERGVYVDTDEDMDDDAIFYDCQSDIPESIDIESNERGHLLTKIDSNKPLSGSAVNTSYRDTVINFVDICFILFEFMYWKLHFFYQNDMRYFFDVASTSDIAARAFGSVIPGYHDRVLSQPDLYGPLMCVFCLPQVFLVAIDTSRNGCSRSSLLGNGVVVCLCMWAGLTTILRVLSFVIAPKLKFSQLACTIGYSFCAWGLSLILSILFETLSEKLFGLPPALPLVLIGLPAAVKQGLIFWEYTAPSPLKLDSGSFPVSLRGFVDRHHGVLQYLVWAVPKVLALVVVTGTHYQCMWYLARVFLPGKQQQCRLSRLIQPSAYADILTQKELIRYAGELIRTGHVPPS